MGPHQCTCCYSVLFTSEHLLKEGTSSVHCSLVSLFSRTGCHFHDINVFILVGFAVRQAQRGGCYFVCVFPAALPTCCSCFTEFILSPFFTPQHGVFFSDGSSIVLKFNSSLKAFNVYCYIKVTVNTGYSLKPQKQNYTVVWLYLVTKWFLFCRAFIINIFLILRATTQKKPLFFKETSVFLWSLQ